jgi:hypothetical protein
MLRVASRPAAADVPRANTGWTGQAKAPSPERTRPQSLESDLLAVATPSGQTAKRWPLYAGLSFWLGLSAMIWAAIVAVLWMAFHH